MTIRVLLTAALLLLPPIAVAIPPLYTLQTGVGSDDVGGEADAFVYLTGAALFSKGISSNSIVDLQGELSTYSFSDNEDRSGEEIFLQGTYSYTPRAGFRVPTYSLGLRHVEEMLSNDNFDSSTTSIIASLSFRLDDRNSLLGGVKLDERDSSDDSETTSYFVNYDFRYSPRIVLYTTLNLGSEDIEAGNNAVAALPNVGARTFVGGHHTASEGGGGGSNVVTESDNTYLTLGASWSLGTLNSLDLSVSHRDYETDGGDVDGNIYSLDFFHRF